ncbi:transglycosylase SLT domain-containing protein [Phaeospirillum tilakii]|uniref:Transglycosylase SLT domain-containing protein n=1 Tax=Phaeospirillum tilakii TaxID=741673 RepID=A0ABW5C8S0_9PROT
MQTPTAATASAPVAGAGGVLSGIREAASATGVPFEYLLAQATRESGLDPQALNSRSTASGLFQFTSQTWLEMIRRHGAKHGLGEQAAAITRAANGRLDITDKALKKAVLDLRHNPGLSAMMAAEYAGDNARILERRLGRSVTAKDLHLAHLLGAGGAVRMLRGLEERPQELAGGILPQAAKANPELFQDRENQTAHTIAGLYQSVQARFERASSQSDLASLRPEPRPDAEVAQQLALAEPAPAVGLTTEVPAPLSEASEVAEAAPPLIARAATTAAPPIPGEANGFRAAIPPRLSLSSLKGMISSALRPDPNA